MELIFLERFFPCVREAAHMGDRMLHQFARSDCGTNCENARTSASLGYLAQPGAASGEKCAMFVLVGNLKPAPAIRMICPRSPRFEVGRASWRDRGCTHVSISVVPVPY